MDVTTKKVTKYDKFTSFKKRVIVDFPLFLLGLIFVASAYFLFDYITSDILERKRNGLIDDNTALIY